MGEEDVTMKQDITAQVVLRPPVQAEDPPWTSKVEGPGKRVADVQTEDLEDNEQWMQMRSAALLPQAKGTSPDEECSLAIGNNVESETHNQNLEDKVAGDMDTRASTKYVHHDSE